MPDLELIIGNKNYSSWSMRAWVLVKAFEIPFTENRIWLDTETARDEKLTHSPAARVPVLKDRGLAVWDSLAITEYLAERFPDKRIWPEQPVARARARSLCAEMHAGFVPLRTELPLNCRGRKQPAGLSPEVEADIRRILDIWQEAPGAVAGAGPFLFGAFSAADAFFAPVASRFLTYSVAVTGAAADYMNTVLSFPAVVDWLAGAAQENRALESVDSLY